jgi:hypothetical protein
MKRIALFVLMLGASLLLLNLLTGCQSIPKNGYKPQPKLGESSTASPAESPSVTANVPSGSGSLSQFKIAEVKHFTQADGLGLSQEFLNYFYNGLSGELVKAGVAGQVINEGSTVAEADAADSVILEGKLIGYNSAWFGIVVKSEIKLYRASDKTLIKTIMTEVVAKSSPFNTDKNVGEYTGKRTAYVIKREMK